MKIGIKLRRDLTMERRFLHIYRNTPKGREILLGSAYFCKKLGINLSVFIPSYPQFLLFFKSEIVTVALDSYFLRSPETAQERVKQVLDKMSIKWNYFIPKKYTAGQMAHIPVDFDYMCCPRSLSNLSDKYSFIRIGSKVRKIIRSAKFPVLIPSTNFYPWKHVTTFFGGSNYSIKALREALKIVRRSKYSLTIFTQSENKSKRFYESILKDNNMEYILTDPDIEWLFYEEGNFEDNLFYIPRETILVLGAFGSGLIKELIFGSKAEIIQSMLPYPMLIIGPRCVSPKITEGNSTVKD